MPSFTKIGSGVLAPWGVKICHFPMLGAMAYIITENAGATSGGLKLQCIAIGTFSKFRWSLTETWETNRTSLNWLYGLISLQLCNGDKRSHTYLERPERCWQSVERNDSKRTLVFCVKHTRTQTMPSQTKIVIQLNRCSKQINVTKISSLLKAYQGCRSTNYRILTFNAILYNATLSLTANGFLLLMFQQNS